MASTYHQWTGVMAAALSVPPAFWFSRTFRAVVSLSKAQAIEFTREFAAKIVCAKGHTSRPTIFDFPELIQRYAASITGTTAREVREIRRFPQTRPPNYRKIAVLD